ncbi:Serine/threonine-protein kinase 33, partial [Perkinsus olseni]
AAVRWCFGVDPTGREMLNRRDRRLVAQHEKLGPLGEGLLVAPPPPKLEHSITDRVRDQVIGEGSETKVGPNEEGYVKIQMDGNSSGEGRIRLSVVLGGSLPSVALASLLTFLDCVSPAYQAATRYEVHERSTGARRACKIISKKRVEDLELLERELQVLISLDHPN